MSVTKPLVSVVLWEPPPTNYNSREYSTELPITILQKVPQLEQELLMVHCQQYGYQMPQI